MILRHNLRYVVITLILTFQQVVSRKYSRMRLAALGRQFTIEEPIGNIRGIEHENCEQFDDDPVECRKAKCGFSCGDGSCFEISGASECSACSDLCFNVCGCQLRADCDYDPASGFCLQRSDERKTCANSIFEEGECRRRNAYYVNGGLVCLNDVQRGNCAIQQVIKAINFGGDERRDSRGIVHEADAQDKFEDQDDTRATNTLTTTETASLKNVSKADIDLYKTYIRGNGKEPSPSKCVKYPFQIKYDGLYELTLKMLETYRVSRKSRFFSVYLNDIPILREIDLYKIIGDSLKGVEIVVNFQVASVINKDVGYKLLIAKGFEPKYINNNHASLRFCYGECTEQDTNYVVSAFSVIRFASSGDNGMIFQPCSSLKLENHRDMCACKQAGCEYNLVTNTCEEGDTNCPDQIFGTYECVQKGRFYASGGVVCKNDKDRGDCRVKNVQKALNLGGKPGESIIANGLSGLHPYVSDDKTDYIDPDNTRTPIDQTEICKGDLQLKGENKEDEGIYLSQIYGIGSKSSTKGCISYKIPFTQDGPYQLILKTHESYHRKPGRRIFTVKLDGVEVLKDVDLYRLHNQACTTIDIVINFLVSNMGSELQPRGHLPVYLNSSNIAHLSFCYGDCGGIGDTNYVIGAFAVYQLYNGWSDLSKPTEGPPEDEDTVTPAPEKSSSPSPTPPPELIPTTTQKAVTETSSEKSPPPSPPTTKKSMEDPCKKFRFNPCGCKLFSYYDEETNDKVYCNYNDFTALCTAQYSHCYTCSSNGRECRRHGAFYDDGGDICLNKGLKGNCTAASEAAVSFNSEGAQHIFDRFDINYDISGGTMPGVFESVGKRVTWNMLTTSGVYDVHSLELRNIFNGTLNSQSRQVYGSGLQGSSGCLQVNFKLQVDGDYELSVKLIDPGTNPAFSMNINGLYLSRRFEPRQYTKQAMVAMDFNINFRVTDNRGTLRLKGYQPMKITNIGYIEFQACVNKCDFESKSWAIGGLSLIRFVPPGTKITDECRLYSDGKNIDFNQACNCKGNRHCEFDTVTGLCGERETVESGGCKKCLFGKQECRRKNTYYANGGILCHQEKQAGDCAFSDEDVIKSINFNTNETSNSRDSIGMKYSPHSEHTCYPTSLNISVPNTAGDEERLKGYWNIQFWNNTHPPNLTHKIDLGVGMDESVKQFEQQLYATHVYGGGFYDNKGSNYKYFQCEIPITESGGYELGILTGDFYYNEPGRRLFNFVLNNLNIVREVDLVATTGNKWIPMRIIVHFIITKGDGENFVLNIKGFPPHNMHRMLFFRADYGDCKQTKSVDNHWHMSAYYLIKYKNQTSAGGLSLLDS